MTDFEKVTEEQYVLIHGVLRSILYHSRRESFFNCLNIILKILIIYAIVAFLSNKSIEYYDILVAVFIFIGLSINFSKSANVHDKLKRRFSDLYIEMMPAIIEEDEDPKKWAKFEVIRLEIEKDEPPVYRALNELCYLAVNAAEGIKPEEDENYQEVKWYQRLTANILKWENIAVK